MKKQRFLLCVCAICAIGGTVLLSTGCGKTTTSSAVSSQAASSQVVSTAAVSSAASSAAASKTEETVVSQAQSNTEAQENGNTGTSGISDNEAKTLFENYAKSVYANGVEFHWQEKGYDFSLRGDGSWHIKVGVTVTNTSGAVYEETAEGVVDSNGISYFKVY